jgi:L,D-peptidoglycan transpeptidase YkuD (ErfK/YbiS/YcfS/YnhG family)
MSDFSVFNIVLAAFSILLFEGLSVQSGAAAYAESRQAVVVRTADWDQATAVLQAFERKDRLSPWKPVGNQVKAVVGRNGLGWGRGLHPEPYPSGPQKKEGDSKAPAGVFALSASFGYAAAVDVPWIKLPYRQATAALKCIDDPESNHYNRLVDLASVTADWKSSEDMRRDDDQYRLGIVVGHNTHKSVPGSGSCIFIHIWQDAETGTSGCTAVSAEDMERLLRWLDFAARPVLIQLTGGEYEQLRHTWSLP